MFHLSLFCDMCFFVPSDSTNKTAFAKKRSDSIRSFKSSSWACVRQAVHFQHQRAAQAQSRSPRFASQSRLSDPVRGRGLVGEVLVTQMLEGPFFAVSKPMFLCSRCSVNFVLSRKCSVNFPDCFCKRFLEISPEIPISVRNMMKQDDEREYKIKARRIPLHCRRMREEGKEDWNDWMIEKYH